LEFIPEKSGTGMKRERERDYMYGRSCVFARMIFHACEGRHPVFGFLLEFIPDLFRGTGMTENCSCRDGVPPPSKWKIGQ